ncbi:TPA: helix-turn-helix domain-containing protein [Yersinia enterocolitica]|uniref:helix-turn-helix domain-containing protein n=1 Tax=Yersinia enterocolitica TaxID=630 RepID=UPI001C8DF0F7|nr:helix-turn-helix domain-containing protein [Yersinia enterocolitica]MBX9488605.1 helix-turn-helix domain-containing protein [Yersinia enterocolitica]MBX9492354.1 helix-turn-helix domain-containing protein [Yersinia enterocolitica]HEN3636229.1 helix-turn-helix domain-containing protein [Yersinia enterocolitica]
MLVSDTQCHQKNMMRQRLNDSALAEMPLHVSDECINLNNGVLFARPLNSEAVMTVSASGELRDNYDDRLNNILQPIVLSTLDNMKITFEGDWMVEILSMSQITTLFSFLDYQAKSRSVIADPCVEETNTSLLMHTERNLAILVEDECKSLMGMLIFTLLKPQNCRIENLFSFVRNVESYWISHFLLSQVMNEDKESDSHKIGNASKIYGVSKSYFRKLCHHAFTRGPKKQLRLWRAAHSALELIEKNNSIAAVAGNNGYASSSHFSSEIKSLFGITPREFKKLEGLLHV